MTESDVFLLVLDRLKFVSVSVTATHHTGVRPFPAPSVRNSNSVLSGPNNFSLRRFCPDET